MELLVLSLPEALYLYEGLALQLVLRQNLAFVVPGVVVVGLFWLASQALTTPRGGWWRVALYFGACVLICVLFWPEATVFGRGAGTTIQPQEVASYAAEQDPNATVVTAADMEQVPVWANRPVLLPAGLRLVLRPLLATPLRLAIALNQGAHRTFAAVMPMHWLLGLDLTTDVTAAVADWVHNCYVPTLAVLQTQNQGRVAEELLPWASPMRTALSQRRVYPGAQTGMTWIRANTGDRPVMACDTYLDAVEFRAQTWLFEKRSPAGVPLQDVFAQELGLDALEQARFLVYREVLKHVGPAIPAPSLTGQYAALRGLGMVAETVGGLFGGQKAMGALAGAGSSEVQRAVDGLSWLVSMAVFLTWWGPYILGIAQLVLLGLFPIVLLWALMPGQQVLALGSYCVALLFLNTMPLWWVLVDEASRLAAQAAPAAGTYALGALTGGLWSFMITVIGILMIPVLTGYLLFLSLRSLGGMWRGVTL